MGNNIIQSDPTSQPIVQKTQQQYSYISEPKQNIIGKPRIVKSNLTNLQLQEYYVSNSQSSIEYDANLYKLRSSSYSKNIAVIFYHKVIDEQEKLFKVRVQKMKGRLNQIDGLTYIQGLCLLQAGLNGFAQLVFHAKTPFVITQKMIAINQSSQVRVWLNENYALNKIMPGIKIRNENIMIHQIFSAIAEHINLEQRQPFNDFRFKIAQCQRLIEAKNIITMSIPNINRKIVLQQLVEKEVNKLIQNPNIINNPIPNQNGYLIQNMNNNINFNTNNSAMNVNEGKSIKIPMNLIIANQQNNGYMNNNTNVASPFMNPFLSFAETAPLQRVHIASEQYIKDDEGSDRIRMVRQEYNSNTKSFNNPTNISTLNQQFQINQKPINNNKQFYHSQPVGNNRNFNQLNQINPNNQNQKNHIVVAAAQNQNILYRQEQKVGNNQPQQLTQRNGHRVTTIFGANHKRAEPNIQTNINQIKTLSPLKIKTINQFNSQNKGAPTTSALSNKIALSQNKISQMERKINKLKQQFNKTNERNKDISINGVRNDRQRIRIAITPPHATITHRSPINQEIRPVTKHQKVVRLKSDTHVGQTAAKWDRKLNQLIGKDLNKTLDQKKIQTNLNYNTQRNSQIFHQQIKQMGRSMITQAKQHQPSKSPTFNKTASPLRKQTINEKKGLNRDQDRSPSFNPPLSPKKSGTPIIINKNPASTTINGVYPMQRYPNQQPKVNINFHGSSFISNINNGYPNKIGFGGLVQNKSSILQRNSHF